MTKIKIICLFASFLFLLLQDVIAGVLPDERIDALFHSYDGGGVQVTGPSILVRKNVTNNTSTFYNYYTDYITSASIDVLVGGSKYDEERTEQTLGVDYLHGKTTLSTSATTSSENDYEATTLSFSLSQDFFGDLTTLAMGYSQGDDTVSRTGDALNPLSNIDRRSYRVGLTQILTKNSSVSVNWETITDQATELNNSGVTLNNPYRTYSYLNSSGGRSYEPEKYPNTRTSNAISIRGNYYLWNDTALHAEYRYFSDSWGISANTFGVGYVIPQGDWIFDVRYRNYSQSGADFYSDLFADADEFTFMGRDKELSTYTNNTIGVSASYEFAKNGWGWVDRGSLNLSWDYLTFDYKDFRDATQPGAPEDQPFYSFDANVIQGFISIWY